MEYLIRHQTTYAYESEALASQNLCCLIPGEFPGQELGDWRLEISPCPEWSQEWVDVYGNRRKAFSLAAPHQQLQICSWTKVKRCAGSAPSPEFSWEEAVLPLGRRWQLAPPLMREFRCASPLLPMPEKPGFDCEDCFVPGQNVMTSLMHFMQRVFEHFRYDPKATDTFTPLDQVYTKQAGVCQDFAHAAIAELRRRGFSAGYVSGFLETLPPPGKEKLRGADATHAWYAVYLPGFGWVHFDPTNNVIPGERHVVTAWGRDYADVAPVKGVVLGGGQHKVDVEVDMWRSPEQVPPEVTGF